MSTGVRRLGLQLIGPDYDHKAPFYLFEKLNKEFLIGWILENAVLLSRALMLRWERRLSRRLPGYRRGGLAPAQRLLRATIWPAIWILCLTLHADKAIADEAKPLKPIFYVENEELARFVTAVGYVFSLQDIQSFMQQTIEDANLVFISGSGLIVDQKIQREFLGMFDEEAQSEIVLSSSDSDECFIQEFTTITGQSFILALNESGNGPLQVDEKCFLLSLSFFDDFSFAGEKQFDELSNSDLTLRILGRLKEEVK